MGTPPGAWRQSSYSTYAGELENPEMSYLQQFAMNNDKNMCNANRCNHHYIAVFIDN
jgi:hypothetical protein